MSEGIIVITGVMASGKSTIAQLLAESFKKSVHLRGDFFRKIIVNGEEPMSNEPSDDAITQLELRYKLCRITADLYFSNGFTIIVQDNIFGEYLNDFVNNIDNRPLYVVVLCPDVEVIKQREKYRNKKGYDGWNIKEFVELFNKTTPKIGLWLDTSKMTPDETVKTILLRLNEAKV